MTKSKDIRGSLQVFLLALLFYVWHVTADESVDTNVNQESLADLYVGVSEGDFPNHEMLLDDCTGINTQNVDTRTRLHEAARRGDMEEACSLIQRGVDINKDGGAGWTPLHYALILNGDISVAKLLIRAGADVDVATAAVGWTPLHLAAALNEPSIVKILLDAGAHVNARTSFGGWTPLDVAEKLDKGAKEIVVILRTAGGQATEYEIGPDQYSMPRFDAFGVGGYSIAGSFTTPDGEDQIIFERLGFNDSTYHELVRLVDQHGTSRGTMVFHERMFFERICLDPQTNTHSLMFEEYYTGTALPEREVVFVHYDSTIGDLTEVFADYYERGLTLLDENGACHWREKSEARFVFKNTIAALEAGTLPYMDIEDRIFVPLPNRLIPAATVASALETIENLPDDVAGLRISGYGESGRWKIVNIWGEGGRDGVKLLWDDTRKEWRSIFDGYHPSIFAVDKDKLFVSVTYRGMGRCFDTCYEVDLATYRVREISGEDSRLRQYREKIE